MGERCATSSRRVSLENAPVKPGGAAQTALRDVEFDRIRDGAGFIDRAARDQDLA